MKVLIAVESPHGATMGIAEVLGKTIEQQDIDVDVRSIDDKLDLDDYDAYIIGSAIYMSRWLKPARDYIRKNRAGLRSRPVWLFLSGPVGSPPVPVDVSPDTNEIAADINARGFKTFTGRLSKVGLSFTERAVVALVHAPEGDYRDWDDVREWGQSIASELRSKTPSFADLATPSQ